MTRDFVRELQDIIKKVDMAYHPKQAIPLFNIHKRSLPVGIDTPVVIGATEEEAKRLTQNHFKTKLLKDGQTLVYYDIISSGATKEEQDVFYNPKEVLQ